MKNILIILVLFISISGFSQTSKMDSLINARHKANKEKLIAKQESINKEIYRNVDSSKHMAIKDWNIINETSKKIGWKKTIQAYSDLFFPIACIIILLLLWLKGKKI